MSNIQTEGRFRGVRAAVLPQAPDGLIPTEVLTRRHIIVLKDSKMIVARRDSQLGVHLANTINDNYSTDNMVIERVNGVYPMQGDATRTIISENTRRRNITKTSHQLKGVPRIVLNTTHFTVKIGSLYELTKYWHEALGHPTLDDMMRMSTSLEGWPKSLTAATLKKHFDLSCEACKHATLQRKGLPTKSTTQC